MVEYWKVKRELQRLWFQIADRAVDPWDRFQQRKYDRDFSKLTQLIDGQTAVADKVAIFFIYQPGAMAKSIAVTCQHLVDQGYAVLLVSSTPIKPPDMQYLKGLCWKILLRPNYGYDFGGYRDGIRVVQDCDLKPEMLLILNDSIWLPIFDNSQLIKKMETSDLFFDSPVFENKINRNIKNKHFQSYLTLVKSDAILSSAFKNYWHRYKVSSKKRIVLLRGEKGFSQALFKAGFGGDAPSTRQVLIAALQQQSNEFLLTTLRYAAYDDEKLAAEARRLVQEHATNHEWRDQVLLHVKRTLVSTQPMGAFCYACIKMLDFSFMKKSSYPIVHDGMRWQYLRAVENGDLPAPHPDILAEIKASKMDGRLTTDPSIPAPDTATLAR